MGMKTRTLLVAIVLVTVGALLAWLVSSGRMAAALAQDKAQPEARSTGSTPSVLPRPDFHFSGNVGRTYLDSDPPQFPQPVQAPTGAPNVVLILLDDAGFGQFSTFGGGVPSPTMDKLAAEGLRFNRFHTTALPYAARRGPTLSPVATTIPSHSRASPKRPRVTTAIPRCCRVVPAPLGRCCDRTGT